MTHRFVDPYVVQIMTIILDQSDQFGSLMVILFSVDLTSG